MRWPSPPARVLLANCWWVVAGIASVRRLGWPWVAGAVVCALLISRRHARLALAALLVGLLAGHLANLREEAELAAQLPERFEAMTVVALSDSTAGPYGGAWAFVRPVAIESGGHRLPWTGPRVQVVLAEGAAIEAGERYRIEGVRSGRRIVVQALSKQSGVENPLVSAGNSLRRLVLERLSAKTPERALLAGFLVGDTSGIPAADQEALRAAGLSHFVAVSGSNVAGFLLLFWIALGPLGVGPRRRGVLGLVALIVFAAATRWEPSVIRASAMAGTVLLARSLGQVVDTWVAFGLGVTAAVLVAPELITDLGFQLSAAATAGILLGSDTLPPSLPVWLRHPLGVGLAAQLAVAPILLASFGEVPLFSPLTNLVAAPLVAVATMTAAIGVLSPFAFLIDLAALISGMVLWIGRTASWLPQLSILTALALAGMIVLIVRLPRLRPVVAAGGLLTLFLHLTAPGLRGPAVVFLDVGQGDAVLVASAGRIVLVDAGPDPRELWEALRRHRVRRLDLIVATHPDDDHVGGMVGLAGRIPIGAVWYAGPNHQSPTWTQVERELRQGGIPMSTPGVGDVIALADITIEVLGPERRYESSNDESIVLLVRGASQSVLLTGDIEVAAQRDLGLVDVDVLKVPHHGAATSDNDWLVATTPSLAVISVGENTFGHPHPAVLAALTEAGVDVVRTDEEGDVLVGLQASR